MPLAAFAIQLVRSQGLVPVFLPFCFGRQNVRNVRWCTSVQQSVAAVRWHWGTGTVSPLPFPLLRHTHRVNVMRIASAQFFLAFLVSPFFSHNGCERERENGKRKENGQY